MSPDDNGRGTEYNPDRRTVLKGIGATGAAVAGGAFATGSGAAAIGDSAVLQFYHTDWSDIKNQIGDIANAGFDAVQVPPAQKSKLTRADQDNDHHPPLGYQPINHKSFDSVFGAEWEYSQMIDAAHNNGLDIIADAVINHMAAGVNFDQFPYFSYNDFHHNGGIDDYSDDWQVENCDLSGLPDLKQESSYVRGQLQDYVDKYASLGVDGIRWDAAKHVPEWFFSDYANQWANQHGLYSVGEVLQGSKSYCDGYAQTGMSVTDYPLYYTMKEDAFHQNGDLSALDGGGYVDWNSYRAMTFVSNHDSDPPQYQKMAYAYILTQEGYPRVYQKDMPYWDSDIQNLLWIRRNLAGGSSIQRHASKDLYVFERDGNLLVGLNRSGSWQGKWVKTSWTNTELSDYAGNNGDNFTTDGNGWVQIWIPPQGWVCYAPA
ncbi:alpha-amylase [Natronoarchaeum philippinense]|uniref:Alpha-amylase n=1 Tax=Natronoarchaeum philippinense TaxID=558529 RepID=A0A285NT50_NATPI|nr:alpha-amylase domain-containing protein [Natronoarchaeum philippinense]SNZ12388.1 alpha-amylase [Natronoarchaeum philippinense]